eukprot:CAMPEP_0179899392 /NCGR_PEP_ID=MMETSP0982-20121206/38363_1 /TAXON_ID=483367 /ORGANISM="non described non described, Strain CCMP 2436" /LENGTH=99 /DNA_ID=CAMNT_0021797183 /DNA_START=66 /DNA_END=365 /DNA_ORIENTATION=+
MPPLSGRAAVIEARWHVPGAKVARVWLARGALEGLLPAFLSRDALELWAIPLAKKRRGRLHPASRVLKLAPAGRLSAARARRRQPCERPLGRVTRVMPE